MANPLQIEPVRKRVLYLDFVRAVAVCLIIISHFNAHALIMGVTDSAIFWKKASGIDPSFLGNFGVSLFIILSGASLMLSTKAGFDAKTFYRNRFLAIYPLFWVTYATTFLALLLIHQTLPANAPPLTFLLTILGLDGFLVYAMPNFYILGEWFLGFIIIMYLFFPFLRYLFLKYPLFAGLLSVCVTLLVGRYYHLEMAIDRFPLFRLMEFMFGVGFIYLFSPSHKMLNLLLCGLSGLLFYLAFPFNVPYPYGLVVQGVCIFICLACVAELSDNLLFAKITRFVSAYSYGAFLVHHVVILQTLPFFENRHLSTFNGYWLFIAVLMFVYFLSYLFTNAVAFVLRKIAATRSFLEPAGKKIN